MIDRREELLDELARLFARAAVDALLRNEDAPPNAFSEASIELPPTQNSRTPGEALKHEQSTRRTDTGAT